VRAYGVKARIPEAHVPSCFLPIGQILLRVFGLLLDNYTAGSLLAAAIATIPNFFGNSTSSGGSRPGRTCTARCSCSG
jgi:hypothetical protein